MLCRLLIILLLALSCYGGSHLSADLNGDCRVDNLDAAILFQQWGSECMPNSYSSYDGSTGFVTVPSNAALNLGTGDFTICFWGKLNSGILQYILDKNSFTASNYYTIFRHNNALFCVLLDNFFIPFCLFHWQRYFQTIWGDLIPFYIRLNVFASFLPCTILNNSLSHQTKTGWSLSGLTTRWFPTQN